MGEISEQTFNIIYGKIQKGIEQHFFGSIGGKLGHATLLLRREHKPKSVFADRSDGSKSTLGNGRRVAAYLGL